MPARKLTISFVLSIVILFQLASCAEPQPEPGSVEPPSPQQEDQSSQKENEDSQEKKAEVQFAVSVPDGTPDGAQVYIDILDEVTGLALNTHRYAMEYLGDGLFGATANFKVGSVIKYRYALQNSPIAIEKDPFGEQIRYRAYYVESPAIIKDQISTWNYEKYPGETGRVQGIISDIANNPLADVLVTVCGKQTITAANGSFLIEGLIPGTHNLVALSVDGKYEVFQQGALIGADSTTPANIQLGKLPTVQITFSVNLPEDIIQGVPVRIIGNFYSFGNTYADLAGGVNTIASRSPLMQHQEGGIYTYTASMPAGADFRYKYSLGDGFWNSELNTEGNIETRQLIIPQTDRVHFDTIETFRTESKMPYTFKVTVPEYTPTGDIISIQFNPYAWTEALPMWPVGDNEWFYVLYSPLQMVDEVTYRYCRNDQCEVSGFHSGEMSFSQATEERKFENIVTDWPNYSISDAQISIVEVDVTARERFTTGIEFSHAYAPGLQAYYGEALGNVSNLGANTLVLSPTWHYSNTNPPILEPIPGQDVLQSDLIQLINWTEYHNLNTYIFPQSLQETDFSEWWLDAEKDDGWWQSWFDRYRTFLIHHAELAEQNGVSAMILGEKNFWMAQQTSLLANGSEIGIFGNSDQRWKNIILEVKDRFSGELILAIDDSHDAENTPEFAEQFDSLYVTVSVPLNFPEDSNPETYQSDIDAVLDKIHLLQENSGKSIIIGAKIASVEGLFSDCISFNDECLAVDELDQPFDTRKIYPIDLDNQKLVYDLLLNSINERDWISGLISKGYYPTLELIDASSSIYGKPASASLWYWFPRLSE